jgi:hypothetical protein
MVDNIKRGPFETSVGAEPSALFGEAGALAGPVTAYIYDWNIIHIGQLIWLKELESHQVPAAAGPGQLQPHSGSPAGQGATGDQSRRRSGREGVDS